MSKQKRYSMAFRERAVRRMKLGDNASKLARELGGSNQSLHVEAKLEKRRHRRVADQEPDWRGHRIEKLEAKMAPFRTEHRRAVDLDFFESALRRIEERRRKNGSDGEKASANGCVRRRLAQSAHLTRGQAPLYLMLIALLSNL
jgi:transposase-like protein